MCGTFYQLLKSIRYAVVFASLQKRWVIQDKFNHRRIAICFLFLFFVFVFCFLFFVFCFLFIKIKCIVFHELCVKETLGWIRVNVWVFSISKWSDASKTGCRVKGKGLWKKDTPPPLEDDGEPEKHSDRSCRTSDKTSRWRHGCFNTKRLEIFPIVFFGLFGLQFFFFFFFWCWSQQVKEQKEMRIITDSSSRAPLPWLQWHWQSVSGLCAPSYSPAYIFKNSNLLLHIFSFLGNEQLAHPAL